MATRAEASKCLPGDRKARLMSRCGRWPAKGSRSVPTPIDIVATPFPRFPVTAPSSLSFSSGTETAGRERKGCVSPELLQHPIDAHDSLVLLFAPSQIANPHPAPECDRHDCQMRAAVEHGTRITTQLTGKQARLLIQESVNHVDKLCIPIPLHSTEIAAGHAHGAIRGTRASSFTFKSSSVLVLDAGLRSSTGMTTRLTNCAWNNHPLYLCGSPRSHALPAARHLCPSPPRVTMSPENHPRLSCFICGWGPKNEPFWLKFSKI